MLIIYLYKCIFLILLCFINILNSLIITTNKKYFNYYGSSIRLNMEREEYTNDLLLNNLKKQKIEITKKIDDIFYFSQKVKYNIDI